MDLGTIPLVGEYSIMGALTMVVIWFIYAIITGRLVPKSTLEEQRKNADTYKAAWETERQRTAQQDILLDNLKVVGENMEKVLNALPVAGTTSAPGGDGA